MLGQIVQFLENNHPIMEFFETHHPIMNFIQKDHPFLHHVISDLAFVFYFIHAHILPVVYKIIYHIHQKVKSCPMTQKIIHFIHEHLCHFFKDKIAKIHEKIEEKLVPFLEDHPAIHELFDLAHEFIVDKIKHWIEHHKKHHDW